MSQIGPSPGTFTNVNTSINTSLWWEVDAARAQPGPLRRLQHALEERGMCATGHLVGHVRSWLERIAR